jgi:hypothetical protein
MHLKLNFQPQTEAWEALAGLSPGVPVRVKTFAGAVHSGEFRSAGGEDIRLAKEDQEITALRQDVERVEVYAMHRVRNAIIGGFIGAAVGVQAGLKYRERTGRGIFRRRSNKPVVVAVLVGCGLGLAAAIAASGYRAVYIADAKPGGDEPSAA